MPCAGTMRQGPASAKALKGFGGRNVLEVGETAKPIGISQGDLSKVLRDQFRGYSEAKLMRMRTAFDQDVEITNRPHRKVGQAGGIIFASRAP